MHVPDQCNEPNSPTKVSIIEILAVTQYLILTVAVVFQSSGVNYWIYRGGGGVEGGQGDTDDHTYTGLT